MKNIITLEHSSLIWNHFERPGLFREQEVFTTRCPIFAFGTVRRQRRIHGVLCPAGANSGDRINEITCVFYILRVAWAIFAFWIALRPLTGAKAPLCEPRLTKKQISSHQSCSILKRSALVFAAMLLSACNTRADNSGPPPNVPLGYPPSPNTQMCGGLMGATCFNPNEYCQYSQAAQCGAADQTGLCTPRPQMCTQEYAPVCGCDARTYGNACTAASNGASVVYPGECRR